jgi:hypothetical protein
MSVFTMNTWALECIPSAGKDWFINGSSENASAVEELKAAESGYTHYVTRIIIRTDSTTDLTIGSGETVGGTIDTVHIGTIPLAAGFGFYSWKAPNGMGLKFTAGKSITIKASAGTCHVEMWGRSCKVVDAS